MTKQFDSLFESLLTELMPVDAEAGSFGSSLRDKISSAPGGGYLIGAIADALGITKEAAVDKISKSLFDKLFVDGRNEANSEEEYRDAITSALKGVVDELKASNPDAKIPGAEAIRKYTARVISNLADATKDFSGMPASKPAVKAAVSAAADESTEDAEDVEGDEDMEEKEVELKYRKAADCNSDDKALCKAWAKLPDDKDLDWPAVCKYVGMDAGMKLIDIGALLETEVEVGSDEDGDVGELEFDDTTDEVGGLDKRRVERELGSDFIRTHSPYREYND